jgi:uncharacterized cysteine cluster protein YcgN (CxxCxxCC family)
MHIYNTHGICDTFVLWSGSEDEWFRWLAPTILVSRLHSHLQEISWPKRLTNEKRGIQNKKIGFRRQPIKDEDVKIGWNSWTAMK